MRYLVDALRVASFPAPPQLSSLAVRITLLSVIRTASDDSCGGGLGTRLRYGYVHNPDVQMDADVESKPVEMVSKWPSYFRIGETRNQETAVQRTFHLERTSFFIFRH